VGERKLGDAQLVERLELAILSHTAAALALPDLQACRDGIHHGELAVAIRIEHQEAAITLEPAGPFAEQIAVYIIKMGAADVQRYCRPRRGKQIASRYQQLERGSCTTRTINRISLVAPQAYPQRYAATVARDRFASSQYFKSIMDIFSLGMSMTIKNHIFSAPSQNCRLQLYCMNTTFSLYFAASPCLR